MIQVKNNQTGDIESLESDIDLPSLVQSGKVSIPNKDYEFESPEGEKFKIGPQGFLDAVKMGWKYRDQNLIKEEKLEQQYGDSTAKALLYGGLRGVSLGLSDAILTKTGMVEEEELSNVKRFNPGASMAGEVVSTVAPVLLSGGTSLAASGARKLLPALLNEGAEYVGKKAAMNVTSQVAKKAIELGTAGAIEGAVLGVGQTISEASLGDAEFNAEALLSNAGTGLFLGAGIGATLGAGIEYAKKAVKGGTRQFEKILINSSDMSEAEKKAALHEMTSKHEISDITRTVFEDAEFKALAQKNGWPTTPGMETKLKIYQTLETSIGEGASAPAAAIQKNIDNVYDTIDNEMVKVLGKSDNISPLVAGDEIKRAVTVDVDSRLAPHRDFLGRLHEEMGNAPFNEIIQKRAINRLSKSPSYRLAGHPRAKYAIDLLTDSKNLNDLEFARKEVGKILGSIRKTGQDIELESFMADAYGTIKRAKKDAVIKNALELGPKRGLKLAKQVVKAMDESDKAYNAIYKDYAPVAERLGIKLNGAEFFLDNLAEETSEKIGQKLIDINDYRFMQDLYKKQPEIYDMARKVQLSKMAKSITDSATGEISPGRFAKKVRQLEKEQREILFGFDGKANARIDELLRYIEKAPKKLNKSDTATVQFFQKILSPVYQASEWARYLLYKGGETAIKKHFTEKLPVFAAVEQAANKQKNKISSSISGFFKASGIGITAASLETFDDKDIEKARKSYELVQSDPEALINKYITHNKQLLDAAPETGNALQQRIIAGVQFLQSKTPHREQDYLGEKPMPSRSELIKFNDFVEAVEKPQIIYEQLKQGYLNPNTLETLRVVYPRTYASIQAEVIAKLPKTISRQQKIQLQPLLGSKVTPAMDYKNLMKLQGKTQNSQMANQQVNQQINHVSATAAKNINASDRSQTGLDKTLNRT